MVWGVDWHLGQVVTSKARQSRERIQAGQGAEAEVKKRKPEVGGRISEEREAAHAKQSFGDKCVTKLELGNEAIYPAEGTEWGR